MRRTTYLVIRIAGRRCTRLKCYEVSTLSGETDLEYDANGSLTSSTPLANPSQASTYGYDVRNKMVSADVNGVTTTYVYDDAGNRVGETTGGVTTFYLTDDDNPTGYAQPIEQKANAAAAPSVTYIIGDRVLGQANSSAAISYLLTDGHGSTRAMTSSAGAVTQTFNFTAFGGAIGFNPAAADTIFLYSGQQFDGGSGVYYMRARGYDPLSGRFTSADSRLSSAGDLANSNLYSYVSADPINGWDPGGHDFTAVETEAAPTLGEFLEADAGVAAHGVIVKATAIALTLGILSGGGLVFMANGSPSTPLADLWEQWEEQPLQDQRIDAQVLVQIGIMTPGEADRLNGGSVPIYFEPLDEFPREASNALEVIRNQPILSLLHYAADGSAGANARRDGAISFAIQNQYGGKDPRTGELDSLDEYPFASTLEGGPGASVVPAPLEENVAQGRDLQSFYRDEQVSYAEPFLVVIVPFRPFVY